LKKEEVTLRDQISVIDATLSGLPSSYVTKRIKDRQKLGYYEKEARLLDIIKEQAELKTRVIEEQQSSGPIFAVARIMKIKDTDAVTALVLLLILVLEPLSIGLTVATTSAWLRGTKKSKEKPHPDATTKELVSLQTRYKLTVSQIERITGRRKKKTCEAWLKGIAPVPERALKAVRAWSNKQKPELIPDVKNRTKAQRIQSG
jgi:hypothetical protein